MKLRWYQEEAVEATLGATSQRHILGLPTGSGKTPVQCEIIRQTLSRNPQARILVGVHTKELVQQTAETFAKFSPYADIGVACAGLGKKEFHSQVVFGSLGTLANAPGLLGPRDLMMIDECHRVADDAKSGYQKIINTLLARNRSMPITGLSATYWRLGEGLLTEGSTFDEVVYDLCLGENYIRLVDEGYLTPLTAKATPGKTIDMSRVRMTAGEINQGDAAEAVREKLAEVIPDALARSEGRRHGMVFVSGVQNVRFACQLLQELGESAVFVTGDMRKTDRDVAVASYKAQKFRWIVSDSVLTTGFDAPFVDVIVFLRATASSSLNVQMMGRGTRIYPDKPDCLVLDYVGNILRCGPINEPVMPRKKGEPGSGEAPAKGCPECNEIVHASARLCPCCGYEFPPPKPKIESTASIAEPMVRTKPVKIRQERVWLWHQSLRTYKAVKDARGDEYVRVELMPGFSYLIAHRDFEKHGIPPHLSTDAACEHMRKNPPKPGPMLWDVSDGKYARHVKHKEPPRPDDIYWFASINETARDATIEALQNDRLPTEDVVKAALRKGGTRLIPVEAIWRQIDLLRAAMKKHGVRDPEQIAAYVTGIFDRAREAPITNE